MKSNLIIFLSITLTASLYSCKSSTSKKTEPAADTAKKVAVDTTAPKELHLTARFTEFSLGDAAHFIFTDNDGKQWDFGNNEDTVYKFAEELPENKANETNQGWTSDKKLQGKLFDLTYTIRNQPIYIDGPKGDVLVILKAELKE